ncbi:hypothetical protein SY88_01175 [Clostridiales bacterium PH28_bin88]|nr:hypothetical protein SY88_01175 [Clostridiales bacterium PH28_bin88]
MSKPDLRGMEMEEVELMLREMGEPAYRGRQVFQWVQARGETDFSQMSNLPTRLRERLAERGMITKLKVLQARQSRAGDTAKYLLEMPDEETVETVLMSYTGREARDRYTVCVSSQVGCAMGCRFCATGLSGWQRNLSAGEITGQVLTVQQLLRFNRPEANVTNVVFMGMGEPLLNYNEVVRAIRILNHPQGLNISMRRITVSTCGLVPEMRRLASEGMPVVLAVSLHAPSDRLRDQLVPVNRKYPLEELMAACRDYIRAVNRRVTFEYALISGINDTSDHARQLAGLLHGMLANVNVIPVNAVEEAGYSPPSPWRVKEFVAELKERGVEAVVREEKGSDIDAACGQLRRKRLR